MATRTWILVADGCRGRVYRNDGPGSGIRPALSHDIYGCDDDDDGAANGNGTAFRGRAFSREQAARRMPGYGIDDVPRVNESFARTVAKILDRSSRDDQFDRLVLVAPPQVLGALRGALPSTVRSRVCCEVGKNLTNCACCDLPKHLGQSVPM